MKKNKKELDNNEEFLYTHTAYLPVFNEESKKIDIWNIRVLVETQEMLVDIEEMNYSEMYRAVHEIKIRLDKELLKGKK